MLDQTHYDIVILDLMLPEMNGYTVLDHIREDHPGVKVVISTGSATQADG